MSGKVMEGAAGQVPAELRLPPLRIAAALLWLRRAAVNMLPLLVMLTVILAVWQVAADRPSATLPAPSKIWADSRELILHPFHDRGGLDKGLGLHLFASLQRVALGFVLSAIAGVALGLLVGTSPIAMRGLDPIFQVLRTVPPLAWLPLSLAAFRDAQPSAIFVIFITAIWPVILNTAAGVQNIPATYRNVGRVLSLNPFEYFIKIMLPATVPHMFTGLRIGVGMSWLAIVAAEMVQGGTGIGFFIWDSYNSSMLSETIVALIWIGMVGFALDRIVGGIGKLIARA